VEQSRLALQPYNRKRGWGRKLLPILAILLFLCAMLSMVAVSGYAGAQAGREDLQLRSTATANAYLQERFLRGLDLFNQGKWALAEANLEDVLRYQPDNSGVQALIATARVAQTPTPVPPTLTPTPIVTDKGALLQLMKDAFARQDWDTVISLGDQLRALDSNYEKTAVSDMRFRALVARGLNRLDEGDIEAGLYDLDIAATIQELDERTESQRQIAALYQNALYYFGADWDQTIRLLTQVYAISPGYRDVGAKLFEAYVLAGDAYAGAYDWCKAEERYAGAVKVIANARTEEKRANAQQQCLSATAVPISGTNGATGTMGGVLGATGMSGRLIYPAADPASGAPQLYVYNSAAGQASPIEVGGSQPAYQRTVGAIAYTAGGIVRAMYGNGSIAVLRNGPGAWPSLSPDGTRIAYAIYENNGWRIYVAPIDGSTEPISLVDGSYPVWGPTGKIAFQGCVNGQCGIQLIDPDNPAQTEQLTTSAGDINIQWSPDGNELVYMTNFTGAWEIYSVTLSKQFRQLTSNNASTGAPTFSPDGSRIAYLSNRDGRWGVWVMGADGSNPQKLIDLGSQAPAWQTERLAWMP
jgi:hypothetical protein